MRRPLCVAMAMALAVCAVTPAFAEYTITTLATFDSQNTYQKNGVLIDAAGNLYGTTQFGGNYNYGTVFKVAAGTNTLTTLVSFNGINGSEPCAGMTIDTAGNLYGTTPDGGAYGSGTVFQLAAGTNTLTTLVSFNGTNGIKPRSDLIIDNLGNLYGTTGGDVSSNPNGYGTVFKIDASTKTLTTLATFNLTNGARPYANLSMDATGNLYGMTSYGGDLSKSVYGQGTVFKVSAGTNALTTLATFSYTNGFNDYPGGGLTIDAAGNLYGTTNAGGEYGHGAVFKVSTGTNTLTTLASFNPYKDWIFPPRSWREISGLTPDAVGNLYGVTFQGGDWNRGTIFRVSAGTHTLSTLATFNGTNGSGPSPYLTMDAAGNLYGTTTNTGNGKPGTVFKVAPTVTAQAVNRTPAPTLTHIIAPPTNQIGQCQGGIVPINNTDSNKQGLLVYSGGVLSQTGTINQTWPTIVLTHGFSSNSAMWTTFAQQYPGTFTGINIVAWNWSAEAGTIVDPSSLGRATSRTNSEGDALGHALVSMLGVGYFQQIHFFGHSLGTLVNAKAVNIFEAQTHDGANTQVTLFDDAEPANVYSSAPTYSLSIPLPNANVARIDNYITAFGNIHTGPNTVNVILQQCSNPLLPPYTNLPSFHSYPYDWYRQTLPVNVVSPVAGYKWAIDNAIGWGFPDGGYLLQSTNPSTPMAFSTLPNEAAAENVITQRNVSESFMLAVAGAYFLTGNLINGPVKTSSTASPFLYGTNSTASFILTSSASPAIQSLAANDTVTPATAATTPSYVWVPFYIPTGIQYISFDFMYSGVDVNDLLMVGINDTQLFALEGGYVADGQTYNSGLLDVSAWAGQDVEFFLGYTGIATNGAMTVENIAFISTVPEPASLAILASGMLFLGCRRRKFVFPTT